MSETELRELIFNDPLMSAAYNLGMQDAAEGQKEAYEEGYEWGRSAGYREAYYDSLQES